MLKSYSQFINEIQFTDTINSLLTEKLDPSVAKKFMNIEKNSNIHQFQDQIWTKLQSHDQFIEASKRQDRLYFEFEPNLDKQSNSYIKNIIHEIFVLTGDENFFDREYQIEDYYKGIAKTDTGKSIKIGKVLNKLAKLANTVPEIDNMFKQVLNEYGYNNINQVKQAFDSDPVRQGSTSDQKQFQIVLSRHSYDIAGMSSNRGWTTCLDLYKSDDKQQSEEYISKDIEYGTFIGYLIKANDQNIENPIGRVLAKPFIKIQDSTKVIYVVEEIIYGTDIGGFQDTVVKIVNSVQDAPDPGKYQIADDSIYCETGDEIVPNFKLSDTARSILNKNTKTTDFELIKEFMLYLFNRDELEGYQINSDGSVDVDYNLIPSTDDNISVLPIYFNEVNDVCNFNDLGLETLEGAPSYVKVTFACMFNKIQNLKDGPNHVDNDYMCHRGNNNLQSLEGLAEYIGGDLLLPKHINDKYSEDQIRQISDIQGDIKFL